MSCTINISVNPRNNVYWFMNAYSMYAYNMYAYNMYAYNMYAYNIYAYNKNYAFLITYLKKVLISISIFYNFC